MDVNLKVIHTKDFIKTTATGILDFEASKRSILDIASQINEPGEFDVLIDMRDARAKLSIFGIFELGKVLADHFRFSGSKIGLVMTPRSEGSEGRARFFETVAINRGVCIRVFTDFAEAVSWLVVPQEMPV